MQLKVLLALLNGASLKSHRYLDGTKIYQLHWPDGTAEPIPQRVVEALVKQGLIYSNQKFPAATYLLTEAGRAAAQLVVQQQENYELKNSITSGGNNPAL
jgi:aryl-alcohol dehydrogenase-like predicted oxidoreductase